MILKIGIIIGFTLCFAIGCADKEVAPMHSCAYDFSQVKSNLANLRIVLTRAEGGSYDPVNYATSAVQNQNPFKLDSAEFIFINSKLRAANDWTYSNRLNETPSIALYAGTKRYYIPVQNIDGERINGAGIYYFSVLIPQNPSNPISRVTISRGKGSCNDVL